MNVKVISRRGQSALVEYLEDGKLRRVTIPARDVIDDQVSQYKLRLGIPYGLPWETICNHPALPDLLRQRGIYTYNDLKAKHQEALNAVLTAYGQDLQTIMKLAKNYGGAK